MDIEEKRPDPDALLKSIGEEEKRRGKLKLFFGYAAGVGKTYAMLEEAHDQLGNGVDVVAGYIEPHTRPETMRLLDGLPVLPPKIVPYRNIELKEFDLDAALQRKPQLILVDELAHTNAKGVRNKKRYQDVEELLNAGIDVYSTVNVQHLESLNDVVQGITKVAVRETVPDSIFDEADQVRLIDIGPEELLQRLKEGKVYSPERAHTAMANFFTVDNLRLLREIAMRKAADRIGVENRSAQLSGKMANIKMLACISPSPSSAKGIRWTARTAEAFHAPWAAVYVETAASRYFSEEESGQVRANLELAERLGAEIVTLDGDDIAQTVAEYAKMSGITNIVVGKSRPRKTLKSLFETDFEDKLIALVPGAEVHIIPGEPPKKPYAKRKMPVGRLRLSWKDTWKTLGILAAATLLGALLRALGMGEQNLIMVYILSVLIVSRFTAGYFYGILASVVSVLLYNFFFTDPYYTLNAIQPEYPVTFLFMLLAALITSALTARVKTQARIAAQREHRTEVLYAINKQLLATRGLDHIVELTNGYLAKLFSRSAVFYAQDPISGARGAILQGQPGEEIAFLQSEDERAVAHWVFANGKAAGAGTDTLMGAGAFYTPVSSQGKVLGVVGLSCKNGELSQDDRVFLKRITSQVAMALERQSLSDEQRRMLVESAKEKMRSNLLRAISHDLRTPLTGILGASSAILENGDKLDKETKDTLVSNIRDDSQWLIRMVENLLSVTRITEGKMSVKKEPEAAEEVVAEAVSRIRKRFPDRSISVKAPKELLLVPMDGMLIEQVLINMLENAVKHSPQGSQIEVDVRREANEAVFEVKDEGAGIAEKDLPHLFEGVEAGDGPAADASRGMGIGLSICMSIVKAHGGSMEAENRKTGGAAFRFRLPMKED